MADAKTEPRGWQVGKSLRECFGLLLENQQLCDVTFNIKQANGGVCKIQAHRLILSARSPVFEAMFCGDFLESSEAVTIVDSDEEHFNAMLRYIYSEEINLTGENVLPIMNLARKYIMDGLVEECNIFFKEKMTVENVCDILTHSLYYGEEELVQTSLNMIWDKLDDVIKTSGFLKMSQEALALVLTLDGEANVSSECRIAEAVLKWVEQQCAETRSENPRGILGKCVYQLRYAALKPEEFSNHFGDSPILRDDEKCAWFNFLLNHKEKYKNQLKDYGFQLNQRGVHFARGTRKIVSESTGREVFIMTPNKDVLLKRFNVYGGKAEKRVNVQVSITSKDTVHTFKTDFTSDGTEKTYPVGDGKPLLLKSGVSYAVTADVSTTDACAYYYNDGPRTCNCVDASINIQQSHWTSPLGGTYYMIISGIIFNQV